MSVHIKKTKPDITNYLAAASNNVNTSVTSIVNKVKMSDSDYYFLRVATSYIQGLYMTYIASINGEQSMGGISLPNDSMSSWRENPEIRKSFFSTPDVEFPFYFDAQRVGNPLTNIIIKMDSKSANINLLRDYNTPEFAYLTSQGFNCIVASNEYTNRGDTDPGRAAYAFQRFLSTKRPNNITYCFGPFQNYNFYKKTQGNTGSNKVPSIFTHYGNVYKYSDRIVCGFDTSGPVNDVPLIGGDEAPYIINLVPIIVPSYTKHLPKQYWIAQEVSLSFTKAIYMWLKDPNHSFYMTGIWRSMADQRSCYARKPGLCAQPGHSLHYWGRAFDFDIGGIYKKNIKNSREGLLDFYSHMQNYGWYTVFNFPEKMQTDYQPHEAWHLQNIGPKNKSLEWLKRWELKYGNKDPKIANPKLQNVPVTHHKELENSSYGLDLLYDDPNFGE